MPAPGKVIGTGQAGRAGPDDGHLTAGLGLFLDEGLPGGLKVALFRHQALDVADGQGGFHLAAAAFGLAGMGADAAQGGRQGQDVQNDFQGLLPAALAGQGHVTVGVDVGRTGQDAGADPLLGQGVGVGVGLGIGFIGHPAAVQALVELGGQLHRTGLGAVAAGRALGAVDKARLFADLDLEIPGLAGNAHDFGVVHDVDVEVATRVIELGRDYAHGAVVGGEHLVQLGHAPADGRIPLHEVDQEAHFRQVESGLHAGDAPADHHHRAYF